MAISSKEKEYTKKDMCPALTKVKRDVPRTVGPAAMLFQAFFGRF
jgi:hypothetical protein